MSREAVGLPDLPKFAERSEGMPRNKAPWMPLGIKQGEDMTPYHNAVKRLERAVYDSSYRAKEAEILSPCPAPKDIARDAFQVRPAVVEGSHLNEIRWTYQNDFGEIPLRDDVRFEISIQTSFGEPYRYRDIAPEALGSDQWRFRHPTQPGIPYSYELKPYRYCFDRTAYSYGNPLKFSAVGRK
jgi:hypothetical protein